MTFTNTTSGEVRLDDADNPEREDRLVPEFEHATDLDGRGDMAEAQIVAPWP